VRRGITLERKECSRQVYKPNPDNYLFDTQKICNTIANCTAKGEKVNWAQLARDNPVTILASNKVASNGNQILKQYALNEGLVDSNLNIKKRDRRSKRKLEMDGIKFSISNALPNAYQLKKETIDRIASGELDIGNPLVPITLDCIRIGKDGNLVTHKITTRGRAYNLQAIMDRLLLSHEKAGYLRDPFPLDGDINTIKKDLESKGKKTPAI
jgi:hypothetical protein